MTYEFNEKENEKFTSLSRNMMILSAVITAGGVFAFVGYFLDYGELELLFSGLLYILLGITLYKPTDNFTRIVTSKGNDIKELLTGFAEIKRWMMFVNIITTLLIAVMTISLF